MASHDGWKEAEWKGSQEDTEGGDVGKGTQPQGQEWSAGDCGPWLRREAQLR